jgi:hypothetical protein
MLVKLEKAIQVRIELLLGGEYALRVLIEVPFVFLKLVMRYFNEG